MAHDWDRIAVQIKEASEHLTAAARAQSDLGNALENLVGTLNSMKDVSDVEHGVVFELLANEVNNASLAFSGHGRQVLATAAGSNLTRLEAAFRRAVGGDYSALEGELNYPH